MLGGWLLCCLFEVVVSELCETGGTLLQHCIMCLAQWVQYVSSSPLIVVSVLQQTYHRVGGMHWWILPTIEWEEPHEMQLMRYNRVLGRKEIGNRRDYCSKRRLSFDMTNCEALTDFLPRKHLGKMHNSVLKSLVWVHIYLLSVYGENDSRL